MNLQKTPFLLLVDEHKFRRAAISSLLSEWARQRDLSIVGIDPFDSEAPVCSSDYAICIFRTEKPLDYDEAHGCAILRALRGVVRERPLVIISDTDTILDIIYAFRAGVNGYLPSGMDPETALEALSFVYAGGTYVPATILEGLIDPQPTLHVPPFGPTSPAEFETMDQSSIDNTKASILNFGGIKNGPGETGGASQNENWDQCLTDRQKSVLSCLKSGKANKQIARELNMSEATVKVHVRQVMKKLGATNRTQAALIASTPPIGFEGASLMFRVSSELHCESKRELGEAVDADAGRRAAAGILDMGESDTSNSEGKSTPNPTTSLEFNLRSRSREGFSIKRKAAVG